MRKNRLNGTRLPKYIAILLLLISFLTTNSIKPVNAIILVTLNVDTTSDDVSKSACTASPNDCSLRGAISLINSDLSNPGPQYQINLGANVYALSTHGAGEDLNATGDLDINHVGPVTITGVDYLSTIISGDNSDRVFDLHTGNLYLQNLSVRYGVVSGGSESGGGIRSAFASSLSLSGVSIDHNHSDSTGGGIDSSNGSLNVVFSILDHNTATDGGGIYLYNTNFYTFGALINANTAAPGDGGGLLATSSTSANLNYSIISNNQGSQGGGIFNSATMAVQDSIVRGNTGSSGGGIKSFGSFNLTRSEVSNNASSNNGVMSMEASSFSLSNVTIADNTSGGASVLSVSNGTGSSSGGLDHVTITGNSSTGGLGAIEVSSGSIRLMNSILDTTDGNDLCTIGSVGAYVTSFDYNISSDSTCNLIQSHDHPNTNPMLYPFGNHGGFSFTAPPMVGSLAIDHANPSFSPSETDQRGFPRNDGDKNGSVLPDIGAAEFLPPQAWLPLIKKM